MFISKGQIFNMFNKLVKLFHSCEKNEVVELTTLERHTSHVVY